jgi:hypothetical protein
LETLPLQGIFWKQPLKCGRAGTNAWLPAEYSDEDKRKIFLSDEMVNPVDEFKPSLLYVEDGRGLVQAVQGAVEDFLTRALERPSGVAWAIARTKAIRATYKTEDPRPTPVKPSTPYGDGGQGRFHTGMAHNR